MGYYKFDSYFYLIRKSIELLKYYSLRTRPNNDQYKTNSKYHPVIH